MAHIDPAEILKCLGYPVGQTADKQVEAICTDAIARIEAASRPASLWAYFDLEERTEGMLLRGTPLILKGVSLRRHLAGCSRVAVFCATLSNEIDKIILQAKFDVLRQLFLDTAASVYVEQLCEEVCQGLRRENMGWFLTKRYGVGYGDLPLSQQREVLTLLNAQKRLGVLATEDGILTPRKSVTALVGLSSRPITGDYSPCDSCLLRNRCNYFARGEHCGK